MMNIHTRSAASANIFWSGLPFRLPDEDVHTLHKHPPSDIQQWALARAQIYENYARALRSVCNAAAPINQRLPPEVLMRVFASISPMGLGEIRLMHVCRSWRAILGRTSEFWVDMLSLSKVWDMPDLLEAILLLSRSRPLAVRAASPGTYSSPWMIPHLCRIVDLSIASTNTEFHQIFQLLQDGHFSNLERLRLVSVEGAISSPPVFEEGAPKCADACLPRLRRMELSPIFFDDHLVVGSVQSLRVLSPDHGLSWPPTETISSPQALLRALRRCARQLMSLHIDFALPADGWVSGAHCPPVDLPVLLELSIATEVTDPVESLLAAITIPSSSSLTILGEGRCRAIALRDLLCDHSSVIAPDKVDISAEYAMLEMAVSKGGKELLKLRVPRASEQDMARFAALVFNQTRTVATAMLHCAWDSGVSPEQALSVLDMFPHLVCLTIVHSSAKTFRFACSADPPLLLSALACTNSSSGVVACPALEELTISGLGREALLEPEALAGDLAPVLARRRAVLGRPLRSLKLDMDLRTDPYFSYEGEPAAQFQRVISTRLETLADWISVTGR